MTFVQHWHVCCGVAPCSPALKSTKKSISRCVHPDWHVCNKWHSNHVLSMYHYAFVHVVTVLRTTAHDVKLHASDAVALTSMIFPYNCLNKVLIHGSSWLLVTPVLGIYKEYGLLTCLART